MSFDFLNVGTQANICGSVLTPTVTTLNVGGSTGNPGDVVTATGTGTSVWSSPGVNWQASGVFYVNGSVGDDANNGSYTAPVATFEQALVLSAAFGGNGCIYCLDAGDYFTAELVVPQGTNIHAPHANLFYAGASSAITVTGSGDNMLSTSINFANIFCAQYLAGAAAVTNNMVNPSFLYLYGFYYGGAIQPSSSNSYTWAQVSLIYDFPEDGSNTFGAIQSANYIYNYPPGGANIFSPGCSNFLTWSGTPPAPEAIPAVAPSRSSAIAKMFESYTAQFQAKFDAHVSK